ncbi:iron-containing alcohol dehydrogenase [Dehalococcoidia bacterium]|nr:iron-containing alcohol dehydrogenase [Dehalococcoidia bacterium]
MLDQVSGGQSRVFLVTGQSHLRRSGILHQVLEGIGSSRITLFDRVSPFPGPQLVAEAVDACRQSSPQVVVAIGGGSVIDVGKLVGVLAAHEGPPRELFGRGTDHHPWRPAVHRGAHHVWKQ